MINQLLMSDQLITIAISFIIGVVMGWITSLAINAAARLLGCLVVGAFVVIQILGYREVMQWDWLALLEELQPWVGIVADKLKPGLNTFTFNLPLSVGFLLGLLIGIRR